MTTIGDKINPIRTVGNRPLGTGGNVVSPAQWDDLRVAASATEANGSNPPTDALFLNDGNEVPGTAYALSFLSTSQGNLTLPDNVAFDTSADFTFGFWCRPVVETGNLELFRKLNVMELDFAGTNQLNLNIPGSGQLTSTLQYNRGSWNWFAIQHSTTDGEVRLYINNVLAATIAGAPNDNANDFLFNRVETLFDMDYVEYWDTVLTPAELTNRYASGAGAQLVGNEVGLKGLWELNDGTGTTVVEKTGIATDGTISGGSEGSQWDWIGGHVGNVSGGSRGVVIKYFSPDIPNELRFDVQIPHKRKYNTNIGPHVHWVANAAGGVGERVRWGLEFTWANIGSVFGNTTIIYATENHLAEDLVKNKHYMSEFPAIDGTGKELSSMLSCRIFRDAENAGDTFTNFAGLLEIDFHYQIDSAGSTQEYVK